MNRRVESIMKLSEQERQFIIQHPRNLSESAFCMKTASAVKINQYDAKMLKVIQFLIQLYVHNCTLSFDKSVQKAQKKFLVSKEDIIIYLQKVLLSPYSQTEKHAVEINKKLFFQTFSTLEEAKKGLQDYLNNPTMLLRHLAFWASTHHREIENFLGSTLKLPKGNDFLILSDALYLLSICPELPKVSLIRILVYRTGSSFEKIEQILNMPISAYLCPKVQKYVIEHFELEEEDSFFSLCYKKAKAIYTINCESQF